MKSNQKSRESISDPTRILTVANFISLGRGLSAIPIIYTLAIPEWNYLAPVIIILAVLSDSLDGYFARKAKEVTDIGKWIDPLADFVVIVSVVLYLVLSNQFPAWYFLFYTIRHAVIAALSIYFVNYEIMILQSNWWGKWSTGVTALTVFLHIFEFSALPWLKDVSLYAGATLLAISGGIYFRDFFIAYRTHYAK